MKRILIAMLLVLLALGAAGCGTQQQGGHDKKFRIVTSFYPMYIDAINITKGVDGVEVVNMTKPQTGCLHDYQLTTEDMKTLEKADAFIVNGAGMESFLDKVIKQQKNLKVIDASKSDDINFLKDGDEVNPHVWLSVTYNIAQVEAITSARRTRSTPTLTARMRSTTSRSSRLCARRCTRSSTTCRTRIS